MIRLAQITLSSLAFGMVFALSVSTRAAPGDEIMPGEIFLEPPTLIALAVEWRVLGDNNHNASVAVRYREKGQAAWKTGMELFRLNGERVYSNNRFDVINPNMFTGSIVDLKPGTAYEIEMTMADPDGVAGPGQARQVVQASTRPEPMPATGGRVFHVYPYGTPAAQKQQPAFEGLLEAYNNCASGTDMTWACRPRVRPGDVILVHKGTYKYSREFYTNTPELSRVPFDGTYYLQGDGTAEKPIVIKAAGDGEVIFDGNGAFNLFNVKSADYNYFEGLTIRNTEIAIWAGVQGESGAKGLTVKKSRFENIGMGVYTNNSRSSDFYIADNWFLGRNDPDHVIIWSSREDTDFLKQSSPASMGQPSNDTADKRVGSYIAVKVYGPGHVIAYNEVRNFHDGIDVETYGNPDGSFATDPNLPDTTNGPKYPPREFWDRRPVAIDIYNNYMDNFHDNPFEADGSLHNIRFMRNLVTNSASHAWTNQPTLGGPIYWIRNIGYHLPRGTTRGESTGAIFYNNSMFSETPIRAASNMRWRNNLILGENFADEIFSVSTYTNYTSSDYNGFRVNKGAKTSFSWNSPEFGILSDQPGPGREPRLVTRQFATLGQYSAATGQDQHSVLLDYDVFMNVPQLDAKDPVQRTTVFKKDSLDFRLKPGSAAVDKGINIPNITDGYGGRAPDLGALESGQPVPHYGPRFMPHWQ